MTQLLEIAGLEPPCLLPQTSLWENGVFTTLCDISEEALTAGHFGRRPLIPLLKFSEVMKQAALRYAVEHGIGPLEFQRVGRAVAHQSALMAPPVTIRCEVHPALDAQPYFTADVRAFVQQDGAWQHYASLEGLTFVAMNVTASTILPQPGWEKELLRQAVEGYLEGYRQVEAMEDSASVRRILHETPPFLRIQRAYILKRSDGWRAVSFSNILEEDCRGYRGCSVSVEQLAREQAVTAELLAAYLNGKELVVPVAARAKNIRMFSTRLVPPGVVMSVVDSPGRTISQSFMVKRATSYAEGVAVAGMEDIHYFLLSAQEFFRGT